jgi:two-component system response regulator HydG
MKEKTRVLIVDDDRRMAKTIYDILTIKGYEAMQAHSGEEAVERLHRGLPDCVLMDMKMPGINGIETMKIIKEMAPGLPVILMSGYATEEQTCEAKQQGAYAVLNKPIDIQAVLSFLSLLRKERSILVVDDDPQFCRTLGDILQSRGYKVETEINPDHVLGNMEKEYKLVVLLDLKLGDKDGVEVLAAIRAKYPSKPVILVTGYGGEMGEAIEKAFQIGAYACLYKPLEIDELINHIEEIDRKKLREVLEEKTDMPNQSGPSNGAEKRGGDDPR